MPTGAPRQQGRRPTPAVGAEDRGWLVGPTWFYVTAAVAIFVVAIAIAAVQATGSDGDAEAAAAPQSTETTEPSGEVQPPAQLSTGSQQSAQPAAPATDAPQDNPLRGFIVPIAGAQITQYEGHLPNATREYRHGIHEGLDFYEWAAQVEIDYVTPILAAKDGVVIRADHDYVDITSADWQRFADANWEGELILDELRGRQVWIDHGRGIVTRYAHLSAIAPEITVGGAVQRGQVIGYPGESGQEQVYAAPGTDIHLHFEIRVSDSWLGQGETPQEARQLYLQAFGLSD